MKSGKEELPGTDDQGEPQVAMLGSVGATAQRQLWPKIARGTILEKLVDQHWGFEHATVFNM